jgi:hypothetical protein
VTQRDGEAGPGAQGQQPGAIDASVAHQARVYDYLLGGKDHFAADRKYADAVKAAYPGTVAGVRANRDFLGRAVRFLATDAGIDQFLDIGTGIPAPGSTHEVAQAVRPDSKIVYVDNDPVVLAHARALLIGRTPGTTSYLDADIREPGAILARAAGTIDLTRPVAVLLLFILHALSDEDDPYRIVAGIMDAVPRGSYLVISHGASDLLSAEESSGIGVAAREMSREQYHMRTQAQVARFFDGLEIVEPGIVQAEAWRPDPGQRPSGFATGWTGVARKP